VERDVEDTRPTPHRGAARPSGIVDGDTSPAGAVASARASLAAADRLRRVELPRQAAATGALRVRIASRGGVLVVGLDRPVLVGRSPRRPRVPDGVEPRLVRVESADQQVSSTHLELRQVGQAVLATDLRSTNGTRIRRADLPELVLQGDALVVAPGAELDLGDGTVIEVLAAEEPT
jgi:pSer/pThr/pTyr-binding forkhead associated (FHA) protein